VAMDRWIFNLPAFTVFGHKINIFQGGSLDFTRPKLGPVDLQGDQAFFIAGSVVFALCLLVIVWVRRSELGQRLLAMKDSPAACATLGMNTRNTTLGVFTLSAAIAGLGGAFYGMGLQSAASNRFEFFNGIAILLSMVIGGVSTVGAALFAGFFLGGPTLANLFPTLTQLTSMTVAFAAIGVGRNPNGFIISHLRPQWEPVRNTPKLLAGLLLAVAVVYGLRLADVLDNWSWVLATLVLVVSTPFVSKYLRGTPSEAEPVPGIEWAGLDRPWTPDDIAELDRNLRLPKVLHGAP
jgi:branched-chain amino acid transport system permease protein